MLRHFETGGRRRRLEHCSRLSGRDGMNRPMGDHDNMAIVDRLEPLLGDLLREQRAVVTPEPRVTEAVPRRPTEQPLIPSRLPGEGEQYAFDVNLDLCSGCAACVVACHHRNGVDPDEPWRKVGLLSGGSENGLPMMQHVTTACHHCIDPACLNGCPAAAYQKDPATGIVIHLDDACIGCQYCTLTCPYDVPVYSSSGGIVRKCDMCHAQMAVGESPACVEACPHDAIRIQIVHAADVQAAGESGTMLPAAPDPRQTLPTTTFHTTRAWPANVLPADHFHTRPTRGHWSLVVMLVLTQMSVGAFAVEFFLYTALSTVHPMSAHSLRSAHLLSALLLGLCGLGTAVLHLGRPRRAHRALLGWRSSWLSREIIAFGGFAVAATAYVGSVLVPGGRSTSTSVQVALGSGATLSGMTAVLTSVMIYVATNRPRWRFVRTASDFALTMLLLGIPWTLMVCVVGMLHQGTPARLAMAGSVKTLCGALMITGGIRLLFELSVLRHLTDRLYTPHRRAAMLLCGELSMTFVQRLFFTFIGGVVLPAVLLAQETVTVDGYEPIFVAAILGISSLMLVAGELLGRYLFFAASVAPRMPGRIA